MFLFPRARLDYISEVIFNHLVASFSDVSPAGRLVLRVVAGVAGFGAVLRHAVGFAREA